MDRAKAFGLVVRGLRKAAKLTQEQLAERLDGVQGLKQADLSKIEGGKHRSAEMHLAPLAAALGVRSSEISSRVDQMMEGGVVEFVGTAAPTFSGVRENETDPSYVHFPLIEGFVAAGAEGYMPDYPEVVKDLKVSKEWVERNLPARPVNIRVLTVQGDSMSPEINSGDVIFIDVGVTQFVTNAIYVMNYSGRPMVKRLQARRDGSVLIKSTNDSYDAEVVAEAEVHDLYVAGRVIGVWKFSRA